MGFAIKTSLGHKLAFVLSDLVFHVAEGVEHRHKGHIPSVTQSLSNHARQPVVGMDNIILKPFSGGEVQYTGGKFIEVVGDFSDGDGFFRAGRNVNHAPAKAKMVANHRLAIVLGAGKYINLNALPSQLTAKVTHINIHATRFLATQHGKWTGVNAEHGNAADRGNKIIGIHTICFSE